MSCDSAHILTLMHIDDLDVQHMMNRFSSTDEEYHSECEEINEEIDSQGPTTIVHGVCNQHSYMVGHATAQREIPQVVFLQIFHFLKMCFS